MFGWGCFDFGVDLVIVVVLDLVGDVGYLLTGF
jgi:hypothetical protein